MLSIQTDINSIKIRNYLSDVTDRLNSCTKKLSTGQKLNNASDDAAGLYLSSGLKTRINSLNIGIDASQTGTSILNIAEGSITNMQNAFQRIRDLAVQASSGYYTTDARQAMQDEADALIAEINREKANCNFNGKALLANTQSSEGTQEVQQATPQQQIQSSSGFHQLTIDDFENLTLTTLEYTYYDPSTWEEITVDVSIQTGEYEGTMYYLVENVDQLKAACNGQEGQNFVFLSDINLSGVEWGQYTNYATIDGNGHKISNFSAIIDMYGQYSSVPFIYTNYGCIKNLGLEYCQLGSDERTAEWCGLFCETNNGTIDSCYIKNSTIKSGYYCAGFCASNTNGTISNSYLTNCNIEDVSDYHIEQFTGYDDGEVLNCFTVNNTYVSNYPVGFTMKTDGSISYFPNCYQDNLETDPCAEYKASSWFASSAAAEALGDAFEYIEGNDHPTLKCENPYVPPPPTPPAPTGDGMRVQVGEDASGSSYLELDLGFDLGVISIDLSTAESAASAINTVDRYLKTLNDKQSLIGASYNRLESVAQSNSVRAENLSASRSTIVDADIAKENSQYVKSQILQSASTSLLAQTANINSQIILGLLNNI